LKKDLEALSDKRKKAARRRKKVEEVAGDNLRRAFAGKKPRSVSQYEAKKLVRASRTIDQRIRAQQAQVAELRTKAKAVTASGTGNVGARDTYLKAAAERLKIIAKLRAKKKARTTTTRKAK